MSAPASHQVDVLVSILKACRASSVSRPALAEDLGITVNTANRWTREMTAQGVLIEHEGPKPRKGTPARVFRLAPEWGGPKQ